MLLKRLAQSYEELGWLDPRNWIQVAANIEADRSNRGRVTQAQADCVAVVVHEVGQVDRAIDIAAVIEDHTAEGLHDAKGEPRLRVQDEELASTHRDSNVGASGLPCKDIAERNNPLRTRFVDGETA